MDRAVLLLSHSQEPFCTERVASALRAHKQGVDVLRIDTDQFPSTLALSTRLDSRRDETLTLDGKMLRASAVWLWRLWPAKLDPRLDARHAEAAQRECGATLRGLFDLLHDVPWIDPIDAKAAAENKTRQLRLARAAGLPIPSTLITSDPRAARQFFAEHDGNVIAKLQTPLAYGMQARGLPTRLLRPADLDALSGLRHCPMMLQRYVPKAYELRIAWVDGRPFVGALDGKKCGIDWRYESTASWQRYDLPAPVTAALARLMSALALRQGAIDMIVTPDGEHVLLEVNPSGEWGMLEAELNLPIAAALADALLTEFRR